MIEMWWYRFLKILYILACAFSFLLFVYVWLVNAPVICIMSCPGSYSDAWLFSFEITFAYILGLRLLRLAVIYIVEGKRPEWKKEFRRLF